MRVTVRVHISTSLLLDYMTNEQYSAFYDNVIEWIRDENPDAVDFKLIAVSGD